MILAQKEGQTVTQNLKQVDTTPAGCKVALGDMRRYNYIMQHILRSAAESSLSERREPR